ncbi:hypothetical protein LDENG_00275460 [Lucifuga dentata]|nr:hypothetical protein LDENG_00275460 [Lucifuga dentata]
MSWLKSVPATWNGEDIFDEDDDDLHLQSREWTINMKRRIRDGYVDGVDAGEDAFLQVGFKEGFREGAAQTVVVGHLKGIVSAISCWCQFQHPKSPVPASVTDLLQRVSQYEDNIVESLRKALENPPPSVSDISESKKDLEVDHGAPGCCGETCEKSDCCRKGEDMKLGASHCHQTQNRSSGSHESLNQLLQRCMDVVLELGLPQELIGRIQELKNMKPELHVWDQSSTWLTCKTSQILQ